MAVFLEVGEATTEGHFDLAKGGGRTGVENRDLRNRPASRLPCTPAIESAPQTIKKRLLSAALLAPQVLRASTPDH
jgi:hypothetical protein